MPIIDLPPALAYTLAGPADAPVIVFINGLGGAQAAFSLQFKDLSRDFRVLTYDHRGMGASAVVDAPVTMATYAADLLALLDHLGLMRVHLVGLSFGGRVAQSLCLMAPERVMGLVLCGTSAGGRLHVPGEGRAMAALHRGGALLTPMKKLKGARLSTPAAERLPTQAMGRGTIAEIRRR